MFNYILLFLGRRFSYRRRSTLARERRNIIQQERQQNHQFVPTTDMERLSYLKNKMEREKIEMEEIQKRINEERNQQNESLQETIQNDEPKTSEKTNDTDELPPSV